MLQKSIAGGELPVSRSLSLLPKFVVRFISLCWVFLADGTFRFEDDTQLSNRQLGNISD